MCKICAEFQLGKLTWSEAFSNAKEMFEPEDEHHSEVMGLLWANIPEEENTEYDGTDRMD